MKIHVINRDMISDIDINETVIRVKALIINTNNEFLLGYSHGTYQFPGGHIELGEELNLGLKRELKEETGIEFDTSNLEPFFLIKEYIKDYDYIGNNKLLLIYYYIINSDKLYQLDKTSYTSWETTGNFSLEYVHINNIDKVLEDSIPLNPINKIIVQEMTLAINEYKLLNQDE